ncbi:autotransporter domain-containing protein [Lysobacter olei]
MQSAVDNARASSEGTHAHRPAHLSRAIATALLVGSMLPGAALAQNAYVESGKAGDANSWRTIEFNNDWGLAAMNAHHAYARGLTGHGVRLGIFDSGADLRHGEFAGKQHTSLRVADAGCEQEGVLGGPEACFYTEGDRASVEYLEFTDADRALVDLLVRFGYLNPRAPQILESWAGFSYGTHGTHVAGSMLANRDGAGTHGVAYGSNLTTARLFSNSYSDVTALLSGIFGVDFGGIELAIGPSSEAVAGMYDGMAAAGVRAINHSWGLAYEPTTAAQMDYLYNLPGVAEYFSTYTQPSLDRGMLQVWAAGNGYGDIAGIYATLPRYVEGLEQYWLSVANLNSSGVLDESSSICGLSKDWCVTAPGTDITSTVVGGDIQGEVIRDEEGNVIGFNVTGETPEFGYGDLTGTSMAAPHVTGALALLMERFPYLSNPQVRDVLLTTATDLGAAGVDEIYGWGLVDLRKAIEGPGLLRVDTNVVMNQRAGGAKVWAGGAWDDWTNNIGGPGRLTKSGVGWLRLSGDNTFAGASVEQGILELNGRNVLSSSVKVNGGVLMLNGALVDTDLAVNRGVAVVNGVQEGGTTLVGRDGMIGGSGTLSSTRVAGAIAPGNSIGTLTINGSYSQAAGSTFHAELSAPSSADLLNVTGAATLEGGRLQLLRGAGVYRVGQQYNLLQAAGGLTGQFTTLDSSMFSPFLSFQTQYSVNGLSLDVARGMAIAASGSTANQRAVGGSIDAMADSAEAFVAVSQLFPEQARSALDQLSGELHASTRSVLVEASRHLRDAALTRAQIVGGDFAAQDADAEGESAAWVQVLRNGGSLHADGNAGRVDYNGDATLLGFDHRYATGWRVGVLGGKGRIDNKLPSRGSEGDVTSRQVAVHAGQSWGGFGLSGGLSYAWHDVDVDRKVSFEGLQDRTRADYQAETRQVFIDAGFRFGGQSWQLEPYAQYARVEVQADGFTEAGGVAALSGSDAESAVDLGTVGLRFNAGLKGAQQSQEWLSVRGAIARRHVSGDRMPTTAMAWADDNAFTVRGATLAKDADVVEAGIGARLSANSLLEFHYSGQFGDEIRDHGASARFSVRF